MNIKLGQVLKEARLQKGFTQTQVAERAGISHPYYNLIENEKSSRPPSFYVIEKIARILGCSPKPLLKNVELMQLEHKRKNVETMEKRLGQRPPKSHPIPILKEVPDFIPDNPEDFPSEMITGFYDSTVKDPKAFIYEVEGDFMAPEIKKADLLLIYPSEIDKVKNGDIVAITNGKGVRRLRRVTFEGDQIILSAENSAYPIVVWKKKDKPKIIGRVKEIIRRR